MQPDTAVPTPVSASDGPVAEAAWQPLPPRSRLLFLVGSVPVLAVLGAIAGYVLGGAFGAMSAAVGGGAAGLVVGGLFGAWLGLKQYRYTFWLLDDEGLGLRRGRLWQRETRVPATRVQHLDLKRGPLQRGRRLATLVVHTAGTRNSSVTVPNLDAEDAERLRDRLAVQADLDDEA